MSPAVLHTGNVVDVTRAAFGLIVLLTSRLALEVVPLRTPDDEKAIELIESLMNKSDSRVRPGVYGPPTNVRIDFFVQSFGPLNEVDMEFATDLDFRQTWEDPRLVFKANNNDPVYIPERNIERFWIPDLYFPNEKHGVMHEITIPNRSIRIYPNGTVRYFCRMAMRLSCTMFLAKFPLDSQICIIKISTYSYDSKEVSLDWWDTDPIEIHRRELQLPQFQMNNVYSERCVENYKTGNYSCIQATFSLERLTGFFILQTYIPSIMIVVLSWVGFWINKDSEPARIALGVTTVLTMTTQLTTSRSNTMRVSYLKAIDVWYSMCMLFVFAALLEYAFVNASSRRERNLISRAKKNDAKVNDVEMQRLNDADANDAKAATATLTSDDLSQSESRRMMWHRRMCGLWQLRITAKNIDRVSRRFFPIGFVVFNLIYWIYYLTPPHFHCNISEAINERTKAVGCISNADSY